MTAGTVIVSLEKSGGQIEKNLEHCIRRCPRRLRHLNFDVKNVI